uniref:Midkine n=4 Tax=Equus TaxID=9789 RepID=A0A3Q2GV19_HORSE
MKVKERWGGSGPILRPLGPVASGTPPPPGPRSVRNLEERARWAPGSEGVSICSRRRAGSGTSQTALVSSSLTKSRPAGSAPPPAPARAPAHLRSGSGAAPPPPPPPRALALGCPAPGSPRTEQGAGRCASACTLVEATPGGGRRSWPSSHGGAKGRAGPGRWHGALTGRNSAAGGRGTEPRTGWDAGPARGPVTHPGLCAPSQSPSEAPPPRRGAGVQWGKGTAPGRGQRAGAGSWGPGLGVLGQDGGLGPGDPGLGGGGPGAPGLGRTAPAGRGMQHRSFLLFALLTLLALTSAVAKKKDKVKKGGPGSECGEWTWGPCTPSSKDCGVGFREGTCGAQTQRIRCRVPCNWKKEFGADCKYKFESWGSCDGGTGTRARQGTLKKARYNAQCQETIRVTKPCTPKTKAKAKAKKGKGKD